MPLPSCYGVFISFFSSPVSFFSSPGQGPGRAIVLPPASAMALALEAASALAYVKFYVKVFM